MPDIYSKKVTRWFFGGKGYANRRAACKAKAIRTIKDQLREIALERHGRHCPTCGGTGSLNHITQEGNCYSCRGEGDLADKEGYFKAWAEEFPHSEGFECAVAYGGKCSTNDSQETEELWPYHMVNIPDSFKYDWCLTAYMKRVNDLTDVLMTEKAVPE